MEIANTIDEKLFMDYTRRRARQIKDIVKKGILEGIDWSDLKQPFGIPSSNRALKNEPPPSHSLYPFDFPPTFPQINTN
jgi:hypothetical protein